MAASDLIQSITIETEFFPPIVIDHPLDASSGASSPLLSILKPKITIVTPLRQPIVSTPYGDPVNNYWLEMQIGLGVLVLVVVGVVAWRVMK